MAWPADLRTLTPCPNFADGASEVDLVAAETRLGLKLPPHLRELLAHTDGLTGEYDLSLVWPLQRIIGDNLHFRAYPEFKTLYMPFDCLLFFSDAGNGDQFAYTIAGGEVRRPDIFVWNHEDDSRAWVSSSLRSFLPDWISGKLAV
mgnify:CR=1 FL=1